MQMKLRVFSSLARTGGTLISRCIGSMQGVALLSEIHPLVQKGDGSFHMLDQAVYWYGLNPDLRRVGSAPSFNQVAQLVAREMASRQLQLVIRDWAHLDFMAVPSLQKPCHYSVLVESLKDDFAITQYHLVRHPVPQWLSTNKLAVISGKLSLEQYLEGHYRHALASAENGFVRYEDFCNDPERSLRLIAEKLDIAYDPEFIRKWPDYFKVTGDTHRLKKRSKGGVIRPAEIPLVDAELYRQLHDCDYYQWILELLGYDDVRVR
jgi:hypothetical protein